MTVGELIEALNDIDQSIDQSLPVFSNQMYEPQTVDRPVIRVSEGRKYVLLLGWQSMSNFEWTKEGS